MIRTMEVFVSPATLTVEPWSAYSYGQQIGDLMSSIKGRLPHRLVTDRPILPVDDDLEFVSLHRARGRVVGGGPARREPHQCRYSRPGSAMLAGLRPRR